MLDNQLEGTSLWPRSGSTGRFISDVHSCFIFGSQDMVLRNDNLGSSTRKIGLRHRATKKKKKKNNRGIIIIERSVTVVDGPGFDTPMF